MSSSIRITAAEANILGTKPIGSLLLKFAMPSIVAMLVMSLYNIVDQLFIGHYAGYLGNAATNVVFPVMILTIATSMLIGEGATALYSIRLGEGKTDEAKLCAGNAFILLATVGVAFSIVCMLLLKPMLGFFGATPAIMPYAVDYAGPIVWGIPFVFIGGGMNALIRANGSPAFAMKAMAAGAVINTVLDPLFIFTFGWGISGAAIATAISQFAGFLFTMVYVAKRNGFGLSRRHLHVVGRVARKIAVCGITPALSQLSIMVVIVLFNKSLVFYGAQSIYGAEIPLAAHGICMKVNQILFSFFLGIGMGAQPIIGFNFGAGNYERVKKAFFISACLAVGIGLAACSVFQFAPQVIINLFGQEEELYNQFARGCFQKFLAVVFLTGFTFLAGTFFQSMARVSVAALIQLSRQVLFMIPAVHLIPRIYGVEGILYCGPITDTLSFSLAMFFTIREFRRLGAKAKAASVRLETQGQGDASGRYAGGETAESSRASARMA